MPAITAGLYKVTFEFLGGNNPALNVLWYRALNGDDDLAEDLWASMDTVMVTAFNDCHHPAYIATSLTVQPIFGTGVEFTDVPTETAGQLGTGTNPIAGHICASIRKQRSTNELRSGWCRVSGLQEDYVSGNTISGDLATSLTTLATRMEEVRGVGGTSLVPCLVRRPGTYASGEQTGWLYTDIASCSAILTRVTTQNTRKAW